LLASEAAIVSVKALPAEIQHGQAALDAQKLNTVIASTGLAFQVKVANPASSRETNVQVVLSISRPTGQGGPIVEQQTLATIGAHGSATVTFDRVGEVPFAEKTSIRVALPTGETRSYPVVFALPSGNPITKVGAGTRIADVVGASEQVAINRLHSLGFQVYLVSVYSALPNGRVVAESPRAGVRLAHGGLVTIDVSAGKPPSG
jgi:hypothetical protein